MPASDLALLIEAARAAADIATAYWRRDQVVRDKGHGLGPVSEADLAVDRMLRDRLLAARPDYGWLSEETEDDAARLDAARIFIVDPIDGTRAFVDGSTGWAHSLAVAEAGRVIAGVVFLPALDKLYAAERPGGAELNGHRLAVSRREDVAGARVLASKPAFDPRLWPRGVPAASRHFRPSLAYRMCLVAEGRFDAMVTYRDSYEWDLAAGSLIVAAAGGVVTDREGRPLSFNSPEARTGGVVAAGPSLHPALIPG